MYHNYTHVTYFVSLIKEKVPSVVFRDTIEIGLLGVRAKKKEGLYAKVHAMSYATYRMVATLTRLIQGSPPARLHKTSCH